MNTPQSTPDPSPRTDPFRWQRSQTADLLQRLLDADTPSLRCFAQQHHLPPASLSYWQRRQRRLAAPAQLVAFFESPTGLAFLHGLVLAAHLVFQQSGACGLRTLILFFRLAGLAPFLACSFGAQQRLARSLQDLILDYGPQQQKRLGSAMPARQISLCEDETFHDQPCLVAIEPVSNFLVVEQYQPLRDAATWDQVVHQALQDLPVEVIQVSSDEAKGILAHTRDGLGAHHSPDLMHLQQDLHRATALPLRNHVERAELALNRATAWRQTWCNRQAEYHSGPPRRGRPPDFDSRIARWQAEQRRAEAAVVQAKQSQQQAQQAIRGLGDDYHPFDGQTGQAVSAAQLRQRLSQRLGAVEQAAQQAGPSAVGRKKIARVAKVLPVLVATLAWFWLQVRGVLAQQSWTPQQRELFKEKVLAWAYWQQACGRGRDAEQRRQLRALAGRCWAEVEACAEWQNLPKAERQRMKALAQELAGRWVRSSSCVEGRNGWLRLRHHGRQGLGTKGLGVLTVLHNYLSRRADGTTAAQRFFGQKPDDLFEWLRQRFPDLPRPARQRKKVA
jgi:hypothetical protein